MDVLSIAAIGSGISPEARAALAEADVIIGVDANDQREFTVFGTPSLESTTSLKKPAAMRIVRVPIDFNGGGLEELIALVQEIKGLNQVRRTAK